MFVKSLTVAAIAGAVLFSASPALADDPGLADNAGRDARRILLVLQVGVGVEGLHQLGIGDDVRRPVQAAAGNDDVFHDAGV